MVRLNPNRVDHRNHNTPILYDREIDALAHEILADYKPELLQEPGRINYQHFLESYLDMRIEFHDIYSEDPERPILAMTLFESGAIRVFDREEACISRVTLPGRTVIIDNAVMEPGRESLALFSGLHEAGHITMHWEVYTLIGEENWRDDLAAIVCCRRENIESTKRSGQRTAADWREHHADYFAAAIAMPNATFIPFVHSVLRDAGFYKGAVTRGLDEDLDILADDILPDAISEVYGVSRRAAQIKLRKTGFVYG